MFFSKKRAVSYFVIAFLFVCVFFANVNQIKALNYINYYGVEMTRDELMTLFNLGFNDNEIYHMDLDTFNANKDLDATLLTSEDKYYKTVYPVYGNSYTVEVTEQEYNSNSEILPLDVQNTTYKHIVTTISANGSRYRYKISLSWKQIPAVKKYDIIGIGYSDDVHIYNSIVYFAFYYTLNSVDYSSTQYYDQKVTDLGATTVYKIPDNITGLSALLYYDVEKDSGAGTLTNLSMCGDYAHATSNSVTSTLAAHHSIGNSGIGLFSDNISLYDAIPCTYASIYGISW